MDFELMLARKLNNYEIYTGVDDVSWIDTTHFKAVVPSAKRWFLFGGVINRDASATVGSWVKDASDDIILKLADQAAGTGITSYPLSSITGNAIFPWPVDAGEYIEHVFNNAQGGGAYANCVVLEVDI